MLNGRRGVLIAFEMCFIEEEINQRIGWTTGKVGISGERGINSILDLFLPIYCISRSHLYPHLLQLLISICRLYLQLYTRFVSFVIFVSHPWDLYFIRDCKPIGKFTIKVKVIGSIRIHLPLFPLKSYSLFTFIYKPHPYPTPLLRSLAEH